MEQDKALGIYHKNINRESFFLLQTNNHPKEEVMSNRELSSYLDLIQNLIADYLNGSYREIPVKTLVYLTSVLLYSVRRKTKYPDKITIIAKIKKLTLLALFINSVKHDLDRYAVWRASKNKEIREI